MSANRRDWKPLAPVFKAAVAEFNEWSDAHLLASDVCNQVTVPLYHYTDAAGLDGIIKNQEVWFTSYTQLNDPSEISYGMAIASEILDEIGQASDPLIKIFCELLNDLFTHEDLSKAGKPADNTTCQRSSKLFVLSTRLCNAPRN
jgi:hypothetical protein